MLEVRLIPEAECEFKSDARWYERSRSGRGVRFAAAVQKFLGTIQADPIRWPIEIDDIRRAGMTGWPYSILYRILPDCIEVISVFHARRDPQDWMDRV
jgi:hypothetical protein